MSSIVVSIYAVSIYAYVLYFPIENFAANLLHYHGLYFVSTIIK